MHQGKADEGNKLAVFFMIKTNVRKRAIEEQHILKIFFSNVRVIKFI
jgi:hypothetical protein